jgi:predicted PurR-regulated permease PerM
MSWRPSLRGRGTSPSPVPEDEPEAESTQPSQPTEPPAPPAPAPSVAPVVVPRWIQLVLLPLAIVGFWALARASGVVLLILIVASLVALILNPVVKLLERRGLRRGLAIAAVYIGGFLALGGIGVGLSQPISDQISTFSKNVPSYIKKANHELDQLQRFLNRNGIHVHIEKQGQTALQTLQKDVLKQSGSILSFTQNLAGKIVSIAFDLVLCLVLSIYLLLYGKEIGSLVRRIMPPSDGTPEDDFPVLVQKAVSGFVRGQLAFSLIMGASAAFALWIFGITGIFKSGGTYAIFFGGFYGLMEFIPYIGPVIGPVPAVAVALFQHPLTALWVVLLFVALQQLEGHFVAPQVFRISLRINPIIIILSLLIGYQLYGVAGALVALPCASVIRTAVIYLRRHLVFEPWGARTPIPGVLPLGPDRCPDCGAVPGPDDLFCRACGTSLEPQVRTPG